MTPSALMSNKRPYNVISLALLACLAMAACEEKTMPAPGPRGPTREQSLLQRISLDPSDVAARLELANHYFDTGRRPQAILFYQKVLEARPDDPNIRTDLGTCLLDARRTNDARAEFKRVMREHPNHVSAVFNLAVLENGNGNPAEAARLWSKVTTMTDDPRIVDQASELAAQARRQAELQPAKKSP